MMDLKKLEINKLFKEFEYVKSDYEYKSEIVREADIEFIKSVDYILEKNEELKSIYKSKVDKKLKNVIDTKSKEIYNQESNDSESETISNVEESYHREDNNSNKIKRIYRQIAKITHPDRSEQKKLNTLYIEASKCYESNDIIGIYEICEELLIPYEIDDSDINLIKNNITIFRDRISFLENTFAWKWINEKETSKNDIVLNYIRNQIGIK